MRTGVLGAVIAAGSERSGEQGCEENGPKMLLQPDCMFRVHRVPVSFRLFVEA